MIFQNQKYIFKDQTRLFLNIILNSTIVNQYIVSHYHSKPTRENQTERFMIGEI